jgi:hypothetical protein
MRTRALEPLEPYPGGVVRPWACCCMMCGRNVWPCYADIQRRISDGCRSCARSGGFRAFEDAMVYLMTHAGHGATKVGITNRAGRRVKLHQRYGWQVVTTVWVPGEVALRIEADVLNWWRLELGLPIYLGRNEMPQGGWTETVDSSEIDLAITIRRVRQSGMKLRPAA